MNGELETKRTVPPGRRIYAVGDIHGMIGTLRELERLIRADAASRPAAENIVVYLGDYIDRGPASRQVIESLIEDPWPGFERVSLQGNHERILLRFLADESEGDHWLVNGAAATMASYGVEAPELGADLAAMKRAQEAFARALPAAHLDFIRRMPLHHVEGDYFFAHAGVRPGVPLDQQSAEDLQWIRDEFLHSAAEFGKLVVHGHSISREPERRANRIGIDTGAYRHGRLTCLVLEGSAQSFLTASPLTNCK